MEYERTFLIPRRIDRAEYLDLGFGAPGDVAANLADMYKINRFLGGTQALTCHLYPRLAARSGPVTVLDLGAGSARLPVQIISWARRRKIQVRVLALDQARRNLAVASASASSFPEMRLLCADAAHLPLQEGSVDYVVSSLFLHHFPPEQLTRLLCSAYQLAARGLVMSDLVRGWLPYAAARLLIPLFFRNFLSRHDGPLSVRRAYTPGELLQLARAAGIPAPQVRVYWPWRMTLVADK